LTLLNSSLSSSLHALPRMAAALARCVSLLVACSWSAQAARRARKRRGGAPRHGETEVALRRKLAVTLTSFEDAFVASHPPLLPHRSGGRSPWTLPSFEAASSVADRSAAPVVEVLASSRRDEPQRAPSAGLLGCFSEPDQADRLGCAVREPCACHWYQRCYPKFMDNPPAEVLAAQVNVSAAEGQVVQVNMGRCGTGISLMILCTIIGFMSLVCVIVFYRAGTLAYAAMRLAAKEDDALARVRAETAAKWTVRTAAAGAPRTQPAG